MTYVPWQFDALWRDERRLVCCWQNGERFAVRNSGVLVVVEGIGDHGSFLGKGLHHQSILKPDCWEDLDNLARQQIRELVELHAAKKESV